MKRSIPPLLATCGAIASTAVWHMTRVRQEALPEEARRQETEFYRYGKHG